MDKKYPAAILAALITGAALAPAAALAQTKPVQAAPLQEPDPAKRIPPAAPPTDTVVEPAAATAPAQTRYPASQQVYDPQSADRRERGRGGAFVAVQGGRGEVYHDAEQSALAVSAGYRWQAGPVWLVGVEAAAGRLGDTTHDGTPYAEVEYASIGVNARFNFGRGNPVYGVLRSGYFYADEKGLGDADGGYAGIGLGVDFSRRFNMSLVYTSYVYFNELYWDGDGGLVYDASRADTLMLGAEVRF